MFKWLVPKREGTLKKFGICVECWDITKERTHLMAVVQYSHRKNKRGPYYKAATSLIDKGSDEVCMDCFHEELYKFDGGNQKASSDNFKTLRKAFEDIINDE